MDERERAIIEAVIERLHLAEQDVEKKKDLLLRSKIFEAARELHELLQAVRE